MGRSEELPEITNAASILEAFGVPLVTHFVAYEGGGYTMVVDLGDSIWVDRFNLLDGDVAKVISSKTYAEAREALDAFHVTVGRNVVRGCTPTGFDKGTARWGV